jgi:myo-inositol-1(or 4)-monophosphatase
MMPPVGDGAQVEEHNGRGDVPADPRELLAVARSAAQAGAEVALAWRERADRLRVEEKAGPADLVSQADREAEQAIRAVLAERRPQDAVLGEEHGTAAGRTGIRWIVDPIDGTTSYLYGRADWAVSVAAAEVVHDRLLAAVVAEPVLGRTAEASVGGGTRSGGRRTVVRPGDDLARALVEINLGTPEQRAHAGDMVGVLTSRVRDLRRGGSAAAALAMVATGRADAAWIPGVRSWDCAAGVLLVQEAGGVVGDLGGVVPQTWPAHGNVLAAGEGLHEQLRDLLKAVYP